MPSNVISEVVVNGNTYGIAASDAVPNLATVEPDATSASKAYTVGEHVVVDDIYYKVIDDIETGDAFIVNTNIEVAKVGDEIERINQHLTANNQPFRFGYQDGKYGYITESGGADTFAPFCSIKNLFEWIAYTGWSSDNGNTYVYTNYDMDTNVFTPITCAWNASSTSVKFENSFVKLVQNSGNHSFTVTAKVDCIQYDTAGNATPVNANTTFRISNGTAKFALYFS